MGRRIRGAGLVLSLCCLLMPAAEAEESSAPRFSIQLAGGMVALPGMSGVDPGAAFGLGVGWRFVPPLVVEAGYLGAIFTEDRDGAGSLNAAVENGGYLALLVAPFPWVVEPYLLGGIGVSHRRLVGDEGSFDLRPGTFARVPVGAGANLQLARFTLGVRGTYDFVLRSTRQARGRADDELNVTLRIGALF